ncbi:recombinase family protein [Saccharopolyspora elongata]|uniref:recombinase family protein n=1 Tax=Saccharopolyspora elongata TaxID=2530387 RepID=UPI001F39571C|nr:recombinase family protein [Saccharopolyspora elongata]
MFAERARGRSVASLARELNARGVPCPADADPARNSPRRGQGWIARTIGLILANPRYTGRQVWNWHSTKGHGAGGRTGGRGSGAVRRNAVQEWEVSEQLSHPALVEESTFLAVQRIRAPRPSKDGEARTYELADLVVCGECGRRMDAHWLHGRAGYRCRHGSKSARSRPSPVPRHVYVREDRLRDALPGLLSQQCGAPPEDDVGKDVGDCLRRAGLEIVCGHEGWRLRPIPGCPAPELVASPGPIPSVPEADFTVECQKKNPATSSEEC